MTKQEMIEKMVKRLLETADPYNPDAWKEMDTCLKVIQETHHLVEKDKVEVVDDVRFGDIIKQELEPSMRNYSNRRIIFYEEKEEYPLCYYSKFKTLERNGKTAINKEWVL